MKVIAVIPAYNEEQTIAEVLDRTRPFVDEIVVVNDGSTDRTVDIARGRGARVVSHAVNRGLGASIGTGFAAALRRGADVVLTLDADGQHDASEIPHFLKAIESGADMVIGSRVLSLASMPWIRRCANLMGNLTTFVLFGVWVSDSQSGFRAFTRAAVSAIRIHTNRMEVSSELVAEAKRNHLRLVEVPIRAIYTDYSLSKVNEQNFFGGLKTLVKLVIRRLSH